MTLIIDYGMGNLNSVYKKVKHLKSNAEISSNANEVLKADRIILPGVGHFGKAMSNLQELNLIEALNEFAIVKKKPILGICLGMQIMATHSEEGDCLGLAWFDANVIKFKHDNSKFKIPHMGWNNVQIKKESPLMKGITEQDEFYFVHSYYYLANQMQDVLNVTEYNYEFCSAVEKDNIYGVQYHPEKSHSSGEKLLSNFLNL